MIKKVPYTTTTKITSEASNVEPKDRENTKKRPRRENEGKGVESLKMKFGGKKYGTQSTEKRTNNSCTTCKK